MYMYIYIHIYIYICIYAYTCIYTPINLLPVRRADRPPAKDSKRDREHASGRVMVECARTRGDRPSHRDPSARAVHESIRFHHRQPRPPHPPLATAARRLPPRLSNTYAAAAAAAAAAVAPTNKPHVQPELLPWMYLHRSLPRVAQAWQAACRQC